MRRLLFGSLAMLAVLAFIFSACGGDSSNDDDRGGSLDDDDAVDDDLGDDDAADDDLVDDDDDDDASPADDDDATPPDDDDSSPADDDDTTPDDDVDVDTARCLTEQAVHVAKDGVDNEACGEAAAPCLTIAYGMGRAVSGDAVCVHAGTYNENFLLVPSGVTLISADGALAAKIYSGDNSAVRFWDYVDGAGIDGFEVYGDWNQGSGDGLIRVYNATNIKIRNTMAHDAPHDQDVIKISGQVSGLLIERVVAWNPGYRDSGDFQEVIDIYGSGIKGEKDPSVTDVIIRDCWLFHLPGKGDWLIYAKINAAKIMYENNVFGPSAGEYPGNPGVGIGTSEAGSPNPEAAVVTQAIVRNNIFVGIKGDAAFSVMNSDDVWVYNNTFYGNSGDQLRSVIMLRGNTHELGETRIFNNVFVNNYPAKNGDGAFFWLRNELPDPWYLSHNLFYDNLAASDIDITGEPNSVYDLDPGLAAPGVPDTAAPDIERIAEIKAGFAVGASSTAVDAGLDAVGIAGHPNWAAGATDRRWDYRRDPRPAAASWDLGADETGGDN